MIQITLDDEQTLRSLRHLGQQLAKPAKLYAVLGETLIKTHAERFKSETSPDGKKWKPLSPLTQSLKGSSRILKDRGYLSQKLAYNVSDSGLAFGSAEKYAPVHQFGAIIRPKNGRLLHLKGRKGNAFARKVEIPARPWLGVSAQDKRLLLDKAAYVLQRAVKIQ